MVEVKIKGCTGAARYSEVREITGARHLRVVSGSPSDRDSYLVDYRDRAEADLAVVNLNTLPGIRAEIVRG